MVELIDKLTEKLYQEGIEKAKTEAQKIIARAEEEKKNILIAAKQEADALTAQTKKQLDDLKKSIESDIRMASQKAMAGVRQKIEDMVTASITGDIAEKVLKDTGYLKTIIEKVVEAWDASTRTEEALMIKLSEKDVKEIEHYFLSKAKQKMKDKIICSPDKNISAGFVLEPAGSSMKIGFTDKDFVELFTFFLRPKIRAFLFGSKDNA